MNHQLTTPLPKLTTTPSRESVADRLIAALQHGDVALVLTRRKLDVLITLVEAEWASNTEFEILQDLKQLRDQT